MIMLEEERLLDLSRAIAIILELNRIIGLREIYTSPDIHDAAAVRMVKATQVTRMKVLRDLITEYELGVRAGTRKRDITIDIVRFLIIELIGILDKYA